jgi:serine/threonine protein kinase
MAEGDSGSVVVLPNKADILHTAPLPQYDSISAKAYTAMLKRDRNEKAMALICSPSIPVRTELLDGLRSFPPSGLMNVIDWGIVDWPEEGRRRLAVIVERPEGDRVMPTLGSPIKPMDEQEIISVVVQPLLPTLKELAGRNLPHRGIRPTNMFYADAARRSIVLGEAFSAPPAYDQPDFMEPIESAQADPSARGRGTIQDDLYALGVSLLMLYLGRAPATDSGSEDLVGNKINNGSYPALVGTYRIAGGMVEILRGLLADDVKERWTIGDIEAWAGGRRLTPKQPKVPARASRPLNFAGEDHFNVRSLAHAYGRNWELAPSSIRSTNFENWLRRTLLDEERINALTRMVGPLSGLATGAAASEPERLASRVSIVLDTSAPLRYKGLGVSPDGIGTAIALSVGQPLRRQVLIEIIIARLMVPWVQSQSLLRSDLIGIQNVYERMSTLISQPAPGYGYERCMYELNPNLPCQSPLVDRLYVVEPTELMQGLERAAQSRDRPKFPMDRHIAGFIGARGKQVADSALRPLSEREGSANHAIGLIRLLGVVQVSTKVGALPSLAEWAIELLEPAILAYYNRHRQQALREQLATVVKKGMLIELLRPFDDATAIERDRRGYNQAAFNYARTVTQIANLEREAADNRAAAQLMGEQAAAVTSGVIGTVAASVITLLNVL